MIGKIFITSSGYDPEYGREPGVASRFVEAVYRSLKEKK